MLDTTRTEFCPQRFQQLLLQHFAQEDLFLRAKLEYHFHKTGKFLRPKLTFELLRGLGAEIGNAYQWAVITEILHNASLIHDDLQDRDEYRRSQESYWKKFGDISAINAGDFLIMKASESIDRLQVSDGQKWQLNRILMSCSMDLVRGQELEQHLPEFAREDLWDRYIDCIERKTASLFVMAVQASAYLSQQGQDLARLQQLLLQYGKCFQLYDDLIDIIGDKGRDKAANDLREGKWSSLVIFYLLGPANDKEDLREFLRLPRQQVSDEQVAFWVQRFFEAGVLQQTKQEIHNNLRDLQNLLANSPQAVQQKMSEMLRHSFSPEILEVIQ